MAHGSHLVSIHSIEEHDFVFSLIPAETDAYIGLVNDNSWKDGSAFDYTKWAPAEPNNAADGQHCGSIRKTESNSKNNAWLDWECSGSDVHLGSVCAKYPGRCTGK